MLTCQQSLNTSVLATRVEGVKLVTQRSALAGNDLVNWSSLERVFDPLKPNFANFLPLSFSTNSAAGLGINVDILPVANPKITPPFVFQTTAFGIPTNFDRGDYILFTGFTPGQFPAIGNSQPLTITFDRPVKAAGTQFAVDDLSNFNILLTAFDNDNNSLGSFSVAGTAAETLDKSPQFVGITSEIANIKKLVYSYSISVNSEFNYFDSQRAFGINNLSIVNPDLIPSSEDREDLSLIVRDEIEENYGLNLAKIAGILRAGADMNSFISDRDDRDLVVFPDINVSISELF